MVNLNIGGNNRVDEIIEVKNPSEGIFPKSWMEIASEARALINNKNISGGSPKRHRKYRSRPRLSRRLKNKNYKKNKKCGSKKRKSWRNRRSKDLVRYKSRTRCSKKKYVRFSIERKQKKRSNGNKFKSNQRGGNVPMIKYSMKAGADNLHAVGMLNNMALNDYFRY